VVTGNYPSDWATSDFQQALSGKFVVLIDTLDGPLCGTADVVIPGATWVEKAGTFENARGMLQAFEQAIPVIELAKSEGQIGLDLVAVLDGVPVTVDGAEAIVVNTSPGQVAAGAEVARARGRAFNAATTRGEMAQAFPALGVFATGVQMPPVEPRQQPDMQMVEL